MAGIRGLPTDVQGQGMEPVIHALVVGKDTSYLEQIANPGDSETPRIDCMKATDVAEALRALAHRRVDVVLVDGDEPGWDYRRVVREIRDRTEGVVCAVVVELGDDDAWIAALTAGACDLLEKRSACRALNQLLRKQCLRPAA